MNFDYKNDGRIGFRSITEDDTDLVLKWRNSEPVRRFFVYKNEITREEHLNWLKSKVDTGLVVQFIVYDAEKNVPFGSVYFRNIDRNKHEAEYGVFIGNLDYVGRGYGTETINLMVKYGFEKLDLDRIVLRVYADNERAVKCYRNAGFVQFDEIMEDGQEDSGSCVKRPLIFMQKLRGI